MTMQFSSNQRELGKAILLVGPSIWSLRPLVIVLKTGVSLSSGLEMKSIQDKLTLIGCDISSLDGYGNGESLYSVE